KYIDEYSVDKTTGLKNKTVTTQTELNLEKISEDEALDGYYLIVTSETQLSLSEVISKYRGLWRIEESFRITKTDLKGRPVFVRTREHIEAHFLTCFISLTMLRMLELRLKHQYSGRKIIDGLNSAMATELSKDIYSLNKRESVVDELDKILGIKFDSRYVRIEDLNRYHSKILKSMYTTP
ncbi:Transposase DDE domain-containing protein, partial [Ruminobacter amylophilus]